MARAFIYLRHADPGSTEASQVSTSRSPNSITLPDDADEFADRGDARRRARIDPAILDLNHLDRYTMGDRALERELLGLFRAQTRQYADRLDDIDTPDDWRLATHSIKGAARCIGAPRVAACAEALEDTNPVSEPEKRRDLTRELMQHIVECERTITALEQESQG